MTIFYYSGWPAKRTDSQLEKSIIRLTQPSLAGTGAELSTTQSLNDSNETHHYIAHIFGGVKGREKEMLSTPMKRKPEVGDGISSILGIFENRLSSELISEGGGESPAKRQSFDFQLSGVSV